MYHKITEFIYVNFWKSLWCSHLEILTRGTSNTPIICQVNSKKSQGI